MNHINIHVAHVRKLSEEQAARFFSLNKIYTFIM